MDQIINWLLLTIIFVFDPLAIALVIAANYAFEQLKGKTKNDPIQTIIDNDQEMKLWDTTVADGLEDEVEESEDWEEYEPNEELKKSSEKYKESKIKGKPVMVDPDTGKLFYEEDDEFDLNKDGILDDSELDLKKKALEIRNSDQSAWAKRKALKKLLREKGYDEDDLTITY